MAELWLYLRGLWGLITRAYRLDEDALLWVRDQPYSLWLTMSVALLAGASVTVGHAVVLLLNRIHGWRFVAGVLITAVGWVMLHAFESIVLWSLGNWASGGDVPYSIVLSGVLVATAPQIWGFLILTPYAGQAIGRLLSAWSAVVLWAVTYETFDVGLWPALGLVGASWLIMHLASTVCAPWWSRGLAAIFERVTGRPLWVSGADVLSGRPMIATQVPA